MSPAVEPIISHQFDPRRTSKLHREPLFWVFSTLRGYGSRTQDRFPQVCARLACCCAACSNIARSRCVCCNCRASVCRLARRSEDAWEEAGRDLRDERGRRCVPLGPRALAATVERVARGGLEPPTPRFSGTRQRPRKHPKSPANRRVARQPHRGEIAVVPLQFWPALGRGASPTSFSRGATPPTGVPPRPIGVNAVLNEVIQFMHPHEGR